MRRFQAEIDIPFIYVTHNQEEALTLSTRMAVMNDGRLEQVGAKLELYQHPATRFVAAFLGSPNHIRGVVTAIAAGYCRVDWDGVELKIPLYADAAVGQTADYFLKHERIRIQAADGDTFPPKENRLAGKLRDIIFKGQYSDYFVVLANGTELVVSDATETGLSIRQPVALCWPPAAGDAFRAPEE